MHPIIPLALGLTFSASFVINDGWTKKSVTIDATLQAESSMKPGEVLFCYAGNAKGTDGAIFYIDLRGIKPSDIEHIVILDDPAQKIAWREKSKKQATTTSVFWKMPVAELPKSRSKDSALKMLVTTADGASHTIGVRISPRTIQRYDGTTVEFLAMGASWITQ